MVQALSEIYDLNYSGKSVGQAMYVTHNKPNDTIALRVSESITKVLSSYFNRHFIDYEFLAAHFVVKGAKSSDSLQLHQDWNVVDESQFYNHQVWIPLGLSYPENGGICFVPESHHFWRNTRSGSLSIPQIEITEKLYPYLSYLRLLPGEAAVFYSKTFHGSFINSTPENRVAVLVNIIQKRAIPLYYHKSSCGAVKGFEVSTEEIFQYLPLLEKGLLPLKKEPIVEISDNLIDNRLIDANLLLDKIRFRNLEKGRAEDYQHKLTHVLRCEELEKNINRDGFAVIDFLDETALLELRLEFIEMFPNRDLYTGAYSGINEFSLEKRKEMYEFIKKTISASLDRHFKNHCLPICSFYSRKPDGQYNLDWHSDPSFILNEHIESIYGIWCPLFDVDEHCGTLQVIPKGHRLLNKLHFSYITSRWPLENKRRLLDRYSRSFQLRAGQAIIFDGRMIHSSEGNNSTIHRDNIVMRVCHKDAEFFSVKTENRDALNGVLYRQCLDFFFSEAIVKHGANVTTGERAGTMYLFNDEIIDDNFIHRRLQ